MIVIDSTKAKNMILDEISKSGKFFGVTFVKKNGTLRKMNCRGRVWTPRVGGEKAFEPRDRGMVFVWDLAKKGYRTVNAKTITEIHHKGTVYIVIDPV